MKTPIHIVLTALLLLTTLPLSAADKEAEQAKDKAKLVSVCGYVARPSVMEYKSTTIYSMIIASGGPTQFGTLKRVKVFRDGKVLQLDLTEQKVKDGELAKPGDIIEVSHMAPPGR